MLGLPFAPRIVPMHPLTPMQQVKRNDELRRIAVARQTHPAVAPYHPPYSAPYRAQVPYRAPYHAPAPYRSEYNTTTFRYRNDWTRAQNERERLRLQALQQQLQQQQAQMQQQQAPIQQVQQMPVNQQPAQVATSAGSPEADLTPAQDAAAEGGDEPAHPHSNHKMLLFGGIVVIAGIGAYAMLHKKKSSSKP